LLASLRLLQVYVDPEAIKAKGVNFWSPNHFQKNVLLAKQALQ